MDRYRSTEADDHSVLKHTTPWFSSLIHLSTYLLYTMRGWWAHIRFWSSTSIQDIHFLTSFLSFHHISFVWSSRSYHLPPTFFLRTHTHTHTLLHYHLIHQETVSLHPKLDSQAFLSFTQNLLHSLDPTQWYISSHHTPSILYSCISQLHVYHPRVSTSNSDKKKLDTKQISSRAWYDQRAR